MTKHGMLFCGLLFACSSVQAGMDPSERLQLSVVLVATSPVLTATGLLMSGTHLAQEFSEGDRRMLVDAREGALHAVANGNLDDVRLQVALALLRKRFDLDDWNDLQLAQWIAVQE